ncbi:MAG: SdpI family protein [Candidatus Micrarchaeia archaeon]
MKPIRILALLLVILSFFVSFYSYSLLPEKIATHWGMSGEANGFSEKSFGTYLLPIITLVVFELLVFFPKIDPMRRDAKGFEGYYDLFVLVIVGFFAYLNVATILFNLGYLADMNIMLIPAFAVLFYVMGILLEHTKPNWFIGIRTPWTLSNETVWDKTHALGAKLFKAIGILALLSLFVPNYGFIVVVGLAVFGALGTVVYSYLEFRKLKRTKKQ